MMNILVIQLILAARSNQDDESFWGQMLVLVIVAAFLGSFWLSRAKAGKLKKQDNFENRPLHKTARLAEAAARSAVKTFKNLTAKKEKDGISHLSRDLQSGMELLELDFLLKVVESANGDSDEKDVAMRKLNFIELLRRGRLNQLDSSALKNYALNKDNIYGKDIQCEAIKILAERTAKSKPAN
ncbi:MAG: hypothetical protein JW947_00750 [Sedimentisphaerales bacterium]|nr:hypothetical protein [Sedimentisphaerales bacterium]